MIMSYKLNIENETYLVQDIHFLSVSTLTREAIGNPFSFVSPIQLTVGLCYKLYGALADYQLQVNDCLVFTSISKYFVSGVILAKETAMANAS